LATDAKRHASPQSFTHPRAELESAMANAKKEKSHHLMSSVWKNTVSLAKSC